MAVVAGAARRLSALTARLQWAVMAARELHIAELRMQGAAAREHMALHQAALAVLAAEVMAERLLPLEQRTQAAVAAAGNKRLTQMAALAVLVSSFFLIQCRRHHQLHLPLRLKSQFQQASRQLII